MPEYKLFEVYMVSKKSLKRYRMHTVDQYLKENGTRGYYRLKFLLNDLGKDLEKSFGEFLKRRK